MAEYIMSLTQVTNQNDSGDKVPPKVLLEQTMICIAFPKQSSRTNVEVTEGVEEMEDPLL